MTSQLGLDLIQGGSNDLLQKSCVLGDPTICGGGIRLAPAFDRCFRIVLIFECESYRILPIIHKLLSFTVSLSAQSSPVTMTIGLRRLACRQLQSGFCFRHRALIGGEHGKAPFYEFGGQMACTSENVMTKSGFKTGISSNRAVLKPLTRVWNPGSPQQYLH